MLSGKEFACNEGSAGDVGSISRWRRFSGGGNSNPFQHSCWRIPWTEESGGLESIR